MRIQVVVALLSLVPGCSMSSKGGQGSSGESSTWLTDPYYGPLTTPSTSTPFTGTFPELAPFLAICAGVAWPGWDSTVRSGDFDGDGQDDLAVGVGDAVHVFFGPLGGGARTFDDADARVVNCAPSCDLSVADLEGDGRDELWAGNELFSLQRGLTVDAAADAVVAVDWGSLSYPRGGIASADFDGDGWLDLAIGGRDYSEVHYGPLPTVIPVGDFLAGAPPPGSDVLRMGFDCPATGIPIVMGDLDGNGLPELIIGDWYNYGWGDYYTYCPTSEDFLVEPGARRGLEVTARSLAIAQGFAGVRPQGDVDGDGARDFTMLGDAYDGDFATGLLSGAAWRATGSAGAKVLLDTVDGSGPFYAPTGVPIGDVDGDGGDDLLMDTPVGNFFVSSALVPFPAGPIDPMTVGRPAPVGTFGGLGDLDGDGVPDLAGHTSDGTLGIWSGAAFAAAVR